MVSNLKMQRPFPTFEEARTLLLLEEINIDDVATDATPSAPPALSLRLTSLRSLLLLAATQASPM
jgi:hypothetical protein